MNAEARRDNMEILFFWGGMLVWFCGAFAARGQAPLYLGFGMMALAAISRITRIWWP